MLVTSPFLVQEVFLFQVQATSLFSMVMTYSLLWMPLVVTYYGKKVEAFLSFLVLEI